MGLPSYDWVPLAVREDIVRMLHSEKGVDNLVVKRLRPDDASIPSITRLFYFADCEEEIELILGDSDVWIAVPQEASPVAIWMPKSLEPEYERMLRGDERFICVTIAIEPTDADRAARETILAKFLSLGARGLPKLEPKRSSAIKWLMRLCGRRK